MTTTTRRAPRPALPQDFNRKTLGQMLFTAARLLDARAQARINHEAGRTVFRAAHARLLPHLGPDGIRLTELARRVDLSKQAVQQVLDEMRAAGLVESVADPDDGRARRVRLTALGVRAMMHGAGVLQQLEDELAPALGPRRLAALRDGLAALLDVLERPDDGDGDDDARPRSAR